MFFRMNKVIQVPIIGLECFATIDKIVIAKIKKDLNTCSLPEIAQSGNEVFFKITRG